MAVKLPEGIAADRTIGRWSVSWIDAKRGRRFHIWLDENRKPQDGWLHSNPIDRKISGHRALDATNAANAPVIAAVLAHCEAAGLFEAALAAEQAARDAKAAEQAEARRVWLQKEAGPALYDALQPFARFARVARELVGPQSSLAMAVESHIAGSAELTVADWDALLAALRLAEEGERA